MQTDCKKKHSTFTRSHLFITIQPIPKCHAISSSLHIIGVMYIIAAILR